MTLGIVRTVSTVAVLALAAASAALAQREPNLSDIAGCNEQAASRTGASALPHPGSRTPESVQRAAPRGEASVLTPGTGGRGEKTDPSGSVIAETPDPLVKGMDATKADDPQYRAAYRECMRAKLSGR
jgi:hypothetical protein